MCKQWDSTCPGLSGSGQGDPGASRTMQHRRRFFRYPQLALFRGRSLFILQTAITKAELHPVTSFGRLGWRECLHRAVKTQHCEHPAAVAQGMPAAARESSFASSAPAKRFHGRKGLFSAHGTASFALQSASAFPMAAAQRQGSVFLWEGKKLLHHCDLCAVSC